MGIQGTDGRLPGSERPDITQCGSHEICAEPSVIMTALAIILIVLSILILISLMGGVMFLLRKYSSSRGDYYTQVSKCFPIHSICFLMNRRTRETSLQGTRTQLSSKPRPGARSRWGESGSSESDLNVLFEPLLIKLTGISHDSYRHMHVKYLFCRKLYTNYKYLQISQPVHI